MSSRLTTKRTESSNTFERLLVRRNTSIKELSRILCISPPYAKKVTLNPVKYLTISNMLTLSGYWQITVHDLYDQITDGQKHKPI